MNEPIYTKAEVEGMMAAAAKLQDHVWNQFNVRLKVDPVLLGRHGRHTNSDEGYIVCDEPDIITLHVERQMGDRCDGYWTETEKYVFDVSDLTKLPFQVEKEVQSRLAKEKAEKERLAKLEARRKADARRRRAKEREAKERKRLKELASKYPEEVA